MTRSLLAVALSVPACLSAQVTGRTVDRGQPVAGTHVELWAPMSRLAQRVTNSRGEFRFTDAEAVEAVAIAVRRIGYAPTRIPLDTARTDYVIELSALATPLPEVSTREAAKLCPNVESAEARTLWEAATRKYLPWQADTMGRRSEYLQFMGHVHAESLGTFNPSRLTRGDRWAVTWVIQGGRNRIRSQGYIRLLTFPHHEPDFGIWGYSSLWSWYTGHFAEPAFPERETLSVLVADAREVVLVFCPRSRRETGLKGTLRLGADSSFISARWTYWNPDRNREPAGGEVVFAPPGLSVRGQRLPLLPLNGLFWRKLLNGRFWQHWEEYDRWILAPTDPHAPGADSARAGVRRPPFR